MATLTTLNNLISQALDIAGSLTHDDALPYSLESSFLGEAVAGQSGSAASIIAGADAGNVRVDGVSGMSDADLGRFLTISGADSAGNNGTFPIVNVVDADTVDVLNGDGVTGDANNGSIVWAEREPYTLWTDMNYARSDRSNIKGVDYDAAIPTYERPSAVGTDVDANLNNLAGNTLDAKAEILNHKFENQVLAEGDTDITLTDAGNLKHADAVDRRGVPINDGADTGDLQACYAELIPQGDTQALTVIGKSVGDIDCDNTGSAVVVLDGETVVISDGVTSVTFEFDDDSSVTETPTLRQVDITTAADEDDVRDALIAAINNTPSFTVLAESGGAGIVKLTNETPGAAGNVAITDTVVSALFVPTGMAGGSDNYGERIFGITQAGGSTSPNSVEVAFYSVDPGDPLSTAHTYTWERDQPTSMDVYIHYRKLMSEVSETERLTVYTHGLVGDAGLSQKIANLQDMIDEAVTDDMVHIGSMLTNTGDYYIWSDLPDVTPSIIEALNAINAQVGDRDYTSALLTDGATITTSLEELATAISAASITRYIEKLTVALPPGTLDTVPATYTPDGTGNGRNLFVFTRGVLRHPGTDPADYDYTETSGTQITWLRTQSAGTLIDWMILA